MNSPRTPEEVLRDTMNGEQITRMPRFLRALVRQQYAESALGRLFRMGMGEEAESPLTFEYVSPKGGVVTVVGAPPAAQVAALSKLADIAIPRQANLTDDDGNAQAGVVLLGELDMDSARNSGVYIPPLDRNASSPQGVRPDGLIEVEIAPGAVEDEDRAPSPIERTASKALARSFLAKRKNGNGNRRR